MIFMKKTNSCIVIHFFINLEAIQLKLYEKDYFLLLLQ